jgi:hypothetical protein
VTKAAALEIAKLATDSLVKILERPDECLPGWLLYPFLFADDETMPGMTKLFLFLVAELHECSTEFGTIVITPTFIWNKSSKELLTTQSVVYFGLRHTIAKFLGLHLGKKTEVVIHFDKGSFIEVKGLSVEDAVHLHRLLVAHTWALMEWPIIAEDSKTLRLLRSDFKEFNRLFFEFRLVFSEARVRLALLKWFTRPDEVVGKEYLTLFLPLQQTAVADVSLHLNYRLKAMSLIAPDAQHVDINKLRVAHHIFCVKAIVFYSSWAEYLDGKISLAEALRLWAAPDQIFEV